MTNAIHIGMLKTGSTWLQRFVFPTLTTMDFGCRDRHAPCDDALRSFLDLVLTPEGPPRSSFETVRMRQPFLLSYEGLMAHPFRSVASRRADPGTVADRLRMACGPDSRVIVVEREDESLRRSLYKQYVQTGGAKRHEEYVREELDQSYFDLGDRLEPWRAHFDDVTVIPYEQMLTDRQQFVHRFAEVLGHDLGYVEAPSQNVSIRDGQIARIRRYNRWFRRSDFNPTPRIALPGSFPYKVPGLMRNVRDIW